MAARGTSDCIKRTLTFVTGNPRKLEEVIAIVGNSLKWELTSSKLDLPELQGEPNEIAKEKCRLAVEKIGGPVITEDTCLCYNALKGLPGPYIKWFLDKLGHDGLNKLLAGYTDKTAYALCTFAFCPGPGEEITLFEGRANGRIVEASGPADFSWDPVFLPDGYTQTYAELPSSIKNTISHRSKALKSLCEHLHALSSEQPTEQKRLKVEVVEK